MRTLLGLVTDFTYLLIYLLTYPPTYLLMCYKCIHMKTRPYHIMIHNTDAHNHQCTKYLQKLKMCDVIFLLLSETVHGTREMKQDYMVAFNTSPSGKNMSAPKTMLIRFFFHVIQFTRLNCRAVYLALFHCCSPSVTFTE